MKPISEEIAALRAMNVAALVERYVAVFGRLPRCKQPTWLRKRIAWRIQEQRFGGLSKRAVARLEELMAEIDLDLGGARGRIKDGRAGGGTVLGTTVTRIWKGREIRAASVDGGWEHDGTVYRSLSAVARHVTGAHWNGRLFFQITKRRAL